MNVKLHICWVLCRKGRQFYNNEQALNWGKWEDFPKKGTLDFWSKRCVRVNEVSGSVRQRADTVGITASAEIPPVRGSMWVWGAGRRPEWLKHSEWRKVAQCQAGKVGKAGTLSTL